MGVQAREVPRKHELLRTKSKIGKPSGHSRPGSRLGAEALLQPCCSAFAYVAPRISSMQEEAILRNVRLKARTATQKIVIKRRERDELFGSVVARLAHLDVAGGYPFFLDPVSWNNHGDKSCS